MNRPRLFCEFPAGLAAVSLRLQGGAHCRPPISRCGNKAGYAQTILGVLGLRSGQGAGAYWWAEADPDVAALLRIYPDPDALREVARIIRGWAGEEPRALWERLRAERRARGVVTRAVGEVAAWLQEVARTDNIGKFAANQDERGRGGWRGNGPPPDGLADRADRLAEVAGWVVAGQWSYRHCEPESGFNQGVAFGSVWASDSGRDGFRPPTTCEKMADRLAEVAETVILQKWSFSERGWEHGYGGPGCEVRTAPGGWTTEGRDAALSADRTASLVEAVGRRWPSVRVSPRIPSAAEVSAAIGTPGDLEGCIVYIDGPYENTTGYGHELPRSEQVKIALDFAGAGATVALSEAEPIPDLVRSGWHSVEITGGRVGQKRTWSKQSQEIITMNKPPQYTVPTQSSLFP